MIPRKLLLEIWSPQVEVIGQVIVGEIDYVRLPWNHRRRDLRMYCSIVKVIKNCKRSGHPGR